MPYRPPHAAPPQASLRRHAHRHDIGAITLGHPALGDHAVPSRAIRGVPVICVATVVEEAIDRLRSRRAYSGDRHVDLHVARIFEHESRMRLFRGEALRPIAPEEMRIAL